MVTEIELKYSLLKNEKQATMKQVKALIDLLLNSHGIDYSYQQKYLTNCYFDTPDLTLRQHRIALRSRGTKLNNVECFEQTIKTSGRVIAGLHQRPEYNIDIKNNEPIISLFPKSIWQEGTDLKQLQQDIIELFSTNFTRHTWLITLESAQVELAFDSGNIACKDFDRKPSIYEIELELVKGDSNALFSLIQILFSQLALRPGQLTKAARGYALSHQHQRQVSSEKSQSIDYKEASIKSNFVGKSHVVEQDFSFSMPLHRGMSVDEAFKAGIGYCVSQLQLKIDHYVEGPSLNTLTKISEILLLIRHGLCLFSSSLSDEEAKLSSELSYFIQAIQWVDNARCIDTFIDKHNQNQTENLATNKIISKLESIYKHSSCQSEALALLHSERFNNLQLALLVILLREKNSQPDRLTSEQTLIDFACARLTQSSKLLSHELENLSPLENLSSHESFFNAQSSLTPVLLTTSWFSSLFLEHDSHVRANYSRLWLDVKLCIAELQLLDLVKQASEQFVAPDPQLLDWLEIEFENLTATLEQSKNRALSMKPYWC
jgi:triphosphatase